MAAENYYGDEEAPAAASPTSEAEPKDEGGETKTALIDSSICPGMQPGDEMVVKIEKVMDKEYLVSYAPEPESEEPEAETEAPAEPMPQGAMASMME